MSAAWDTRAKFAIVTGAGSGINLAFAEQLLQAGCSVVFADIAMRLEAEETLSRFPYPPKNHLGGAVFHKMDQSNWAQIQATWNFAIETFGRVDLICPGAGVWEPPTSSFWVPPGSPQSKDSPSSSPGVYQTLSINAMGPIRFAQIAIDYWFSNKIAGNLLFVSSLAGYLPFVSTPLYNASKAALNAFILSLSQMKTRFNIRAAVVCPGTVFTPAVLQEYCKGKVREGDMNLTAKECAEVMLRVATEAGYGDGSVVEAIQCGPKDRSDVRVRVVPYMSLLPPLDFSGDFSGKNLIDEEEKLWEKLKTHGMQD